MKFVLAVAAAVLAATIIAFLSNPEVVLIAATISVGGVCLFCFASLLDTAFRSEFPFVRLAAFISIVLLGMGRNILFTTEAAPVIGVISFYMVLGYVISSPFILLGR